MNRADHKRLQQMREKISSRHATADAFANALLGEPETVWPLRNGASLALKAWGHRPNALLHGLDALRFAITKLP